MGIQKLKKKPRRPKLYPVPDAEDMEKGMTEEELNSYVETDFHIDEEALNDWVSESTESFDDFDYHLDRGSRSGYFES